MVRHLLGPGSRSMEAPVLGFLICFVLFHFAVLGFELTVFTLSHSTSPTFVKFF
jgi:hypothetical protein